MGKSDEPTLIPIDEDLGGAKKKTTNKPTSKPASKTSKKISVKSSDVVSKREAEKISDAADALVLDDVKPAKKPTKSVAKAPAKNSKTAKTGVKAGTKPLVMDGMVRQKAATKAKPVDTKGDLDVKADALRLDEGELIDDDEDEKSEAKVKGIKHTKQFSKSKAALIAIAVAILVGAIGMALMFFLNRQGGKMCTLQFESNGGSKIESQEVVCGTKASRPDDPKKEGFEFQDWLADGMPFNFDEDTVDKDMVVMAKWLVDVDAEIVRITFDSAGGSEVTEREAIKGKPTTAPLDPTRDGYTFDGWYLDGEKFDFDTPIDEDITLVAGWKSDDGTVTIPQGGGNSGETSNKKPALDILSAQQGIVMKVGQPDTYPIGVNPVSAEVDIEVSSSNPSVVSCTKEGNGRSMSCAPSKVGEATITVRDKISGKTATTTIKVEDENSGYVPTRPTNPTCSADQELVDGKCVDKTPPEPTEPTEEEKCENSGGTWNGTTCDKQDETGVSLTKE